MRVSRRILILKADGSGVFLLIHNLIKCGGLGLDLFLDGFNFS